MLYQTIRVIISRGKGVHFFYDQKIHTGISNALSEMWEYFTFPSVHKENIILLIQVTKKHSIAREERKAILGKNIWPGCMAGESLTWTQIWRGEWITLWCKHRPNTTVVLEGGIPAVTVEAWLVTVLPHTGVVTC